MNKTLTLLLLGFFLSCSNLSKNMVKEGDFSIHNGVHKNKQWNTSLDFQRVSWFHELTLLYDFMYAAVDKKSDFYNWFSQDEKRRIKSCSKVYVTLNYSLDADRISEAMLDSQLRDQGFESYLAPQFSRTLKTHPDFEHLSLSLYKVKLFCSPRLAKEKLVINFPNFKQVEL